MYDNNALVNVAEKIEIKDNKTSAGSKERIKNKRIIKQKI